MRSVTEQLKCREKNNKCICKSGQTAGAWRQGRGFVLKLCMVCHHAHCRIVQSACKWCTWVFVFFIICILYVVLVCSHFSLLCFGHLQNFVALFLLLLIWSQVHSHVLLFLCFLFACHPSFWHTQVMTVKGSSILRHTPSSSHSPPGLDA